MAQAPLLKPRNKSPEYYVPAMDASTLTTEQDFILQELFPDSIFETLDDDFDLLSENPRKRKFSFDIYETNVDTSETVQVENLVKEQTLNLRNEKIFLCKVCEKDLGGHSEEVRTTKWYKCCVCRYRSNIRAFFQQHIHIHCAKNVCDICKKEYTVGEPHYSENTCNVCKLEFNCKTFLDQHCVLDHEKYFMTHCWVCNKPLKKHSSECGKTSPYVCCSCGYTTKVRYSKHHNNTHRPQLFCFRCKEEYPANEMDRHGKEFKCFVCKETFQCMTFLEDHFNVNHKVSSLNCLICPEPLNRHKKDGSFHCCNCQRSLENEKSLQRHLHIHTRLRLFKCDVCGKRFSYPTHRTRHSNSCSPSLFKCEICRARFPTGNSLQDHCSEKHSDIK